MKKLTQAMIDEALPQEKEFYLFDNQIKGLGCRILPSGIKTYYYRYTSPIDKKRKNIKIENAKLIKLEEARNKAQKYSIEIYDKNDPQITVIQKDEEQQNSITFAEFWPTFEKEYLIINQKESTMKTQKSKIADILKFFGHMKIDEIKPRDVINFRDVCQYKSCFHICLSYLRTALKFAEVCELRPIGSNPCLNVTGWPVVKRERYLSNEELTNLTKLLELEIKEGKRSFYTYYAMLCLIYTGQRKNEIVKLKWEDIDFKQKIAKLHDSKVGKRDFILSDQMIATLNQIPKIEGNPYIFCGENNNSYTRQINDTWLITRAKIGLEDVRIHDLRHSFASFHINNGADLYDVSKMLGHSSITTTQRYAHLSREKLHKVSNSFVFK